MARRIATATAILVAIFAGVILCPTIVEGFFFKRQDENQFHAGSVSRPDDMRHDARQRQRQQPARVPQAAARRVPAAVSDAESALLQQLEERALFSTCWREAVAALKTACSDALATEEDRSRLALQFTSCQLEMDGKSARLDCPHTYDLKHCVAALGSEHYPVYVQFRLHASTLCFHIEADNFQARTIRTVSDLDRASIAAAARLRDISEKSAQVGSSLDELRAAHRETRDAATALHRLVAEQVQEQGDALGVLAGSAERIAGGIMSLRDEAEAAKAQQTAAVHAIAEGLNSLTKEQAAATEGTETLARAVQQLVTFASTELEKQQGRMERLADSADAIATHALEQRQRLEASNLIVIEALERLSGTFASFDALIFYVSFAAVAFFVTAAPRTQTARLPAMVSVAAALVFENWCCRTHRDAAEGWMGALDGGILRFLVLWLSRDSLGSVAPLTTERHALWCIRNAWMMSCTAAIAFAAWRYEAPECLHRRIVREELLRFRGGGAAEGAPKEAAAAVVARGRGNDSAVGVATPAVAAVAPASGGRGRRGAAAA